MKVIQNINSFISQYLVFFLLVLLVVIIVLLVQVILLKKEERRLQSAYRSFMRGNNGKSLETIMKKIVEDNRKVKQQCKNDIETIAEMKKGLKATYKKIGLVKYDTFRGMSGKLSFSLALLDGEDSGFVLSSMHTQEGCYSYLKEIIHGESHATLSNEERDALRMALGEEKEEGK